MCVFPFFTGVEGPFGFPFKLLEVVSDLMEEINEFSVDVVIYFTFVGFFLKEDPSPSAEWFDIVSIDFPIVGGKEFNNFSGVVEFTAHVGEGHLPHLEVCVDDICVCKNDNVVDDKADFRGLKSASEFRDFGEDGVGVWGGGCDYDFVREWGSSEAVNSFNNPHGPPTI